MAECASKKEVSAAVATESRQGLDLMMAHDLAETFRYTPGVGAKGDGRFGLKTSYTSMKRKCARYPAGQKLGIECGLSVLTNDNQVPAGRALVIGLFSNVEFTVHDANVAREGAEVAIVAARFHVFSAKSN